MEATHKNPKIDEIISLVAGKDRVPTIESSRCMGCDRRELTFRNDLSRKEYTISGLCQHCQDEIFGED